MIDVKREDFAEAPRRTEWGAGMLHATVGLDKDSCVDIYVHKDDLDKLLALLEDARRVD